MAEILLRCSGVRKSFGAKEVLRGVDLDIFPGEIVGLLGPNGAGKTTLIRCITCLIKPSSGSIMFQGEALSEQHIQHSFGFLPENFLPPGNLTAEEFLTIMASGLGVSRVCVRQGLERVGLAGREHAFIREYSRGMIQRLGLAAAVLKRPRMVILDEPTLGLDPVGQVHMLALLQELNREGTTIFFSSHTLSLVEKLCHRVGIIRDGGVRFCGTTAEFIQAHASRSLEDAFIKEMS